MQSVISDSINPAMWQQTGGLIGLIIFALFMSLGLFGFVLIKIYEFQRQDMKVMMDAHANERDAWNEIIDSRQKETNAAINGMSATIAALSTAIHELSIRSRRYDSEK